MSRLKIAKYPDGVLRKKCPSIKGVGTEEKALIIDMAAAMYDANGIGLAAPQVGVAKSVIVVDAGCGLLKMANPRIISKKGTSSMDEGCLSVPEKSVTVRRAEEISVSYIDENGKERVKAFSGLAARVILHEIDHLRGKLILDYLPWYKKIFSKKGDIKCRL